MKQLFGGAFIFAAIFSFLGTTGHLKFETLRLEATGKESFEFFLYLLTTSIGIRGILASRKTQTLFQVAGWVTKLTEAMYVSISGAILGWIGGILILAAALGRANDVALGSFIFALVLLLSRSPLRWLKEVENEAREFIEFRIRKRRFKNVFRILCILYISIGTWGFMQFFG